MLDAIKRRLDKCETWKQPHDDIEWLVEENARLQSERDMLLSALQRIVWNGFLDDVPTSVKDEAERVIAIARKEKE